MRVLVWLPLVVALLAMGSPRFEDREAGTFFMAWHYPVSEPFLKVADRSSDPEVRERAVQARRMGRWGLAVRPKN